MAILVMDYDRKEERSDEKVYSNGCQKAREFLEAHGKLEWQFGTFMGGKYHSYLYHPTELNNAFCLAKSRSI